MITGAAGHVGYDLANLIAHGSMLGKHQPVILHLFDIPGMVHYLHGLASELRDCSLRPLEKVIATTEMSIAFANIDIAIMLGSVQIQEGMEKKDILGDTLALFRAHGEALERYAKKVVKVVVVAHPANTNAYILSKFAPSIPKNNFSCLLRLDHNRAIVQASKDSVLCILSTFSISIAKRLGVSCGAVHNVVVWGCHGNTEFPDLSHAYVIRGDKKIPVSMALDNEDWTKNAFLNHIRDKSTTVSVEAMKATNASVAARAIVDHVHDWWFGTPEDTWTSMGVYSRGEYGAPNDVIFGFPVTIKNREPTIVEGLPFNDWGDDKFETTARELMSERQIVLAACKDE
ncbi:unnamed protein product [Schistocephalus solidus]|uniref:Malate dehydrogenase, cytoplasmic n=1 Tax=Schistocephalus solidus TaxID=70667 RepID=A0A3P7CAN4_SCHSO|nr:unnamed protein product [Schistocephalus solidus]